MPNPNASHLCAKLEFPLWEVTVKQDEDGHLNVWITGKDGSTVTPCDADIALNDEEWAERFTTAKIEEDFAVAQAK